MCMCVCVCGYVCMYSRNSGEYVSKEKKKYKCRAISSGCGYNIDKGPMV